jgi:hypothetical protein
MVTGIRYLVNIYGEVVLEGFAGVKTPETCLESKTRVWCTKVEIVLAKILTPEIEKAEQPIRL